MDQKEAIVSKINRSKRGRIFLPDSFLPIDPRHASNVLAELTDKGKLVRVSFGIYVKPVLSRLGPVMPSMHDIATTIAARDSAQILPAGPTAENFLGFSTQVPTNVVYLTSGTPRRLNIGARTLTLKHSVPRTFAYKGQVMPILVLALKSIGQRNVSEDKLDVVYGVLKRHPEERTWQSDVRNAPRWIRTIIINTKEKILRNEQMD